MKRYVWPALIVAFFAVVPAVSAAVRFYTDWLWFLELNYPRVFLTVLVTRIQLGLLFGGSLFILLAATVLVADALSRVGFVKIIADAIEIPGRENLEPHVRRSMLLVAAFLALVMGIESSTRWALWLRYLHPTSFGKTEPLFGKDISFYVFQLPFYDYLYQWVFAVLIFALLMTIVVYGIKNAIVVTPKGPQVKPAAIAHISVLVAAIVALKALGYRLMMFKLLVTQRGFVSGAGYTDVHFAAPVLSILFFVAVVAAVGVLAAGVMRSWKVGTASVAVFFVVSVVASIVPQVYQKFRVVPNEITMERPYILRQIAFTRAAFALDRVTTRAFSATETITPQKLRDNTLTIRNIRLWDARPLLDSYRQLQEIRPYYQFTGVDVDRYRIRGQYTQVNVSARELATDKLPSRIWINEHLTYTHGFGLCMSPVIHFSTEGMPDFLIKDIPPTSHGDLRLDRPEIYYGQLSNDYVFVKTASKEFDYPLGDSNHFTKYNGEGGVPIRSFTRRLAFAARFSSMGILLNTDIGPKSRIMFDRGILQRIQKIMPVVSLDLDPYPVVYKGRVVWIVDAYTVSSTYPYSEDFNGFNYIRNPLKITVDAYDGDVHFYTADPTDPIIRTWDKIFPGVFKPLDSMPAGLRAHIRYPLDLFKVQAKVLRVYHMQDPQVFYNKEDQWDIPKEIFYREVLDLEPYYAIMKLPGETSEEYVLAFPFTPISKDNMAAMIFARMDGDKYGQLILFHFPKKKLIYGPLQVEARIDQDTDISRQFSLWNQRGSMIIRGNMLVVPIEQGLLYVEPIYLMAEKGQIPELKRVVVSLGDRVNMEPTLFQALEKITGGTLGGAVTSEKAPPASAVQTSEAPYATGTTTIPAEFIEKVRAAFRDAQDAYGRGDFAAYGRAMQRLQNLLNDSSAGK